jgi:hypothetical protein
LTNSQVKGKTGELEVVHLLKEYGFKEAMRRPVGDETNGQQGRDIEGTPGLCVQVQRVAANPRPLWKLSQAQSCAAQDEVPLALVRANHSDWMASLTAVDFLHLWAHARATGYAPRTGKRIVELPDELP